MACVKTRNGPKTHAVFTDQQQTKRVDSTLEPYSSPVLRAACADESAFTVISRVALTDGGTTGIVAAHSGDVERLAVMRPRAGAERSDRGSGF